MPTEQKQFYRQIMQLALPVTIQNAITASLNMVDTVMIGQLGATEIAAVGQANRFFFILFIILFAVSSGTAIFTAQYWGKKDTRHIGKVMAFGFIICTCIGVFFSVAAIVWPRQIMQLLSLDADVIALGGVYLWIVGLGSPFAGVSMLYAFVLRSMEQPKIPLYASVIALAMNTGLNYCMIFGHGGFPVWGVKGAAIATLIARIAEAAIVVTLTYWKKYPAMQPGDFFGISPLLVKQYITTALPVLVNEFMWVIGTTMYGVVYGRMGTAAVAAMNILGPVEQLTAGIFFGMANAASVMIGNQIGAGQTDVAFRHAKRFAWLTPLGALGLGALIAVSAPYLPLAFNVTPEIRLIARNVLFVLAGVFWIKMFNMVTIVGILRGGGDTQFSMYLEMLAMWLVGVPLAYVGGLIWKLPVYLVSLLVNIEEFLKLLFEIQRIFSRKWIHHLAHHDTPHI